MQWTEQQRKAFAQHEEDQRRRESQLSFAQKMELLANMWATAQLFGHLKKPTWTERQDW